MEIPDARTARILANKELKLLQEQEIRLNVYRLVAELNKAIKEGKFTINFCVLNPEIKFDVYNKLCDELTRLGYLVENSKNPSSDIVVSW